MGNPVITGVVCYWISMATKTLPTLSPEDMEMIRVAANELAMKAAELTRQNPYFAMGALSLATATVGAIIKIEYAQLVKLISDHYEHALLQEVADEFRAAGAGVVMVPKPEEAQ